MPTGGTQGAGGIQGSGGTAVGGSTPTGGAATGGTATGGTPSGGRSFGGFGGRASGGAETDSGGTNTGGTNTGGADTGGTATGGSATGGATTGGAPSGGASTGGSTGAGGAGDAKPSAGCGKAPTLTSGKRSIQTSGSSRSFILSIPDNYDNNDPHRLIFAFHWNGGTSEDIDGGGSSGAVWSYYGLRAQANDSTIFVAPQGNNNGWANPGGQDLAFVDDMVQLIEEDLCVDTTRLFALGFSYGGGMSYAIACARATVFRAVAVYSGAQLSGCDGGKDPIAYLGIHGISDGTCNIAGGRSLRDTFVRNNGCAAQNPPEPAAGSLTHTCTSYEGCDAGYPVEWCAFDGGHTPGMVDGGGDDGAKTWTKEEVWKFFTQF
jgi:poly(3-hydroxybutyrate) depolymerase